MRSLSKAKQRANRQQLADMLEHRMTNKQFDMKRWSNTCGTVGCALGIAVLSGEFEGLGWNKDYDGYPCPVVGRKVHSWHDVGHAFFGSEAYLSVFTNLPRFKDASRKDVADALRAIQ